MKLVVVSRLPLYHCLFLVATDQARPVRSCTLSGGAKLLQKGD